MKNINKNLIFVFLMILHISCNKDLAYYSETVKDAQEKGLLINEYKPIIKFVNISNHKFEIVESWTSNALKNIYSKEIVSSNSIPFKLILKNTGNASTESDFVYLDFIKSNYPKSVYNGIGISNSQYTIFFDRKVNLDTIKLNFLDNNLKIKEVIFTKK